MDEHPDEDREEHTGEHHDEHMTDQGPSVPMPPDAAAATEGLRALTLRLLWPRYPLMPVPASEPELLVGQLPADLPVAVPLPPQSRVIGSLASQESANIVLDCDLGAEAVLDFYREQLGAQGWTIPGMRGPRQGGFVHESAAGPQAYVQFCQGNRGLSVTIHEAPGRPLPVHLQLDTYDDPRQSPCAPPDPRLAMRDRIWAVIPPLTPPLGARQRPEGGSGGQDVVITTARLKADLNLAAVTAHYARQFERAQWTHLDEGTSGPAGWSAWSFKDEGGTPWHGLFVALRQPHAPNEYFLLARAARDDDVSGEPRVTSGMSVHGGWTYS